jgi:uncharacterized DUF497 family protein
VEIVFDPRKSERNLVERGISFAEAARFDFRTAEFSLDARRDYGEIRTRSIGFIDDTLHALVFTMRGKQLRVIRLRRASRKERIRYADAKARPD